MSTCPTCAEPIDPMRAPAVRIRGGRVVSYCSVACADNPSSVVRRAETAANEPGTGTEAGAGTGTERTSHGSRRRQVLALCAAMICGGMAVAVLQAVSPGTPTRVDAAPVLPAPVAVERVVPPPDPIAVRTRAQDALRVLMDSPSARVRRVAAIALSRSRDPAALTALATALRDERGDVVRLEIAHALGRAGDARGVAALGQALKTGSTDVKNEAARLLLQLGDDRGLSRLRALLAVSQHRLGAAEALAAAGDDKAIALLREVHREATTPEVRLRAAVALGRAGRADDAIRADLRAALTDGHFNAGAAAALAGLGDDSAAPVLTSQLAVPPLRTDAAVALRRLEPDLDPIPLLPPLAAALDTDDRNALSAAESILILTAPRDAATRAVHGAADGGPAEARTPKAASAAGDGAKPQ